MSVFLPCPFCGHGHEPRCPCPYEGCTCGHRSEASPTGGAAQERDRLIDLLMSEYGDHAGEVRVPVIADRILALLGAAPQGEPRAWEVECCERAGTDLVNGLVEFLKCVHCGATVENGRLRVQALYAGAAPAEREGREDRQPPERSGGKWVGSHLLSEQDIAQAQAKCGGLDWFADEAGFGWVWIPGEDTALHAIGDEVIRKALNESAAEVLAREIHSAEKWDEDTITLPMAVARALAAALREQEEEAPRSSWLMEPPEQEPPAPGETRDA